jgi:hypothetical protein
MHGNATIDKDPIYALMFRKARAAVGDKVEESCRKCHNPLWKPDADTQLPSAEGVTCVVCHQIAGTHPVDKLASGEHAILDPKRSPQGLAQALCLSCHAERKTGKGVPICITGSENEDAGAALCVDCHMLPAEGPASMGSKETQHRSHTFPGGHDAALVASAATLELSIDKASREIVATIKPGALGHSLPTGNPMRHIILTVVATDAKGAELWRNRPKGEPLLKARESVFMRAFADADGNSPVPPFASQGEPSDNRLRSGKIHEQRYPLPKGAARLSATLHYHLAPAAILEEAQAPPHWSTPVEMARVDIDL